MIAVCVAMLIIDFILAYLSVSSTSGRRGTRIVSPVTDIPLNTDTEEEQSVTVTEPDTSSKHNQTGNLNTFLLLF